jgi:ribosomal protein S18 acetylase RimI-like enzyme
MIEISLQKAAEFMKRDVYHNLSGLIAVELNSPPVPQRVFADSEDPAAIMHVYEWPEHEDSYISLTGYNLIFLKECADWLRCNYNCCRGGSDNQTVFTDTALSRVFGYDSPRRIPSLVCKSPEYVLQVDDPRIRVTTAWDRPAVERYAKRCSNPQDLLLEGAASPNEKMYGMFEDEELLGYLTAGYSYPGIWDVFNIHVREDRRNQGIGAKLAVFYAKDMFANNLIPYYSGAGNEASERTAKKAGFVLCLETFHTRINRKA